MITEIQIDILVQKWAKLQRSQISGQIPWVGHHLIGRSNRLLRHDLSNILICTLEEHTKIHCGEISDKYYITDYLNEMKNVNYKTYLQESFLSEQDFYKERKQTIINSIKNLGE